MNRVRRDLLDQLRQYAAQATAQVVRPSGYMSKEAGRFVRQRSTRAHIDDDEKVSRERLGAVIGSDDL